MKTDIGKAFNKLVGSMFFKYRGCSIEKLPTGYRVFGENHSTIEAAKKAVDQRYITFNNIVQTQNRLV